MVFFRKLNFRPNSSRNETRDADKLRILLDDFKAAPIPPSETDWQDLRRRMAAAQKMPSPRTRTMTAKAKIAFAVCAAFALAAARFILPSAPRKPVSQTSALAAFTEIALFPAPPSSSPALRNSNSVPQNTTSMTRNSNSAPRNTKTAAQNTNSMPQNTKMAARNTKMGAQNSTAGRKFARFRLAARPRSRRFAKRLVAERTPLKLALKPKAPNPEQTKIALSSDGENQMFLILPVDYILPPAQTEGAKDAPQTYVTAAIPAAPTPGTTENESKERHPW